MKKSLKNTIFTSAVMAIVSGTAFGSIKNIENPLYMPSSGDFYSKTGAGIMYKKADRTTAIKNKGLAGSNDFPVWRFTEDMGYGITDKLSINGRFGWTQDDDINRKGMHRGRVGLLYRLFDDGYGFVWDVYSDAYLSGITPMKASVTLSMPPATPDFTFKNYSNGRWGVYGGTRFGKTWSRFTASGFFEYLQTFGNHNNEIEITGIMNDEISVDLKSTHEINFGISGFYQMSQRWSGGLTLEFNEHSDNGLKSVHGIHNSSFDDFAKQYANMNDGWQEYIIKFVLSNQITDYTQISWFLEYTCDRAHDNSQNGTDVKMESGFRINFQF